MASFIPIFGNEDDVPKELGELTFHSAEIYDNPELGVRLHYYRGMTKADIYVYNLGIDDISDDIRSDQTMQFFQDACANVLTAGEQGIYLDLETRASQFLHLPDDAPDPTFLWAAFYFRQKPGFPTIDEGFRFSHILVRTDLGYVTKIRYTYPESVSSDAGQDMLQFVLDWHDAIKGYSEN